MGKKRMERLCQEIGRGVEIIPGEVMKISTVLLVNREEKRC